MGLFNRGNSSIIYNNKAIVNGVKIDIPEGASVSIRNNKVFINGEEYKSKELENKELANIIVNGNAGNISCDNSVEVKGNVKGIISCGNSVSISGNHIGTIDANNVHVGKKIK